MHKLNILLVAIFLSITSVSNAGMADKLNGVWEGHGYQSTGSVAEWSIKFTANNGTYNIEYPSLSCGGKWELLTETTGSVIFHENIEYGSNCVDEGTVEILLLESNKLRFIYFLPNGNIDAFGELKCLGCNIISNTVVLIPL